MMVTCLTMALLMCLLSSVATASSSTRNLRAHGRLQERDVLLTSQQEFIDQCTVSLLSDDAVDDDLISQDEFTQFLSGYCIQQAICDPGSTDFTNLSVELQLAFVMFICNEPMEVEREQCLDELKNSGDSFGYFLQIEEREVLDTEIAELCAQAYLHSIRSGLLLSPTTLAPTMVPPPVVAPTEGTEDTSEGEEGGLDESGKEAGSINGGDNNTIGNRNSVSNGLIVGVAIAGVVLVLAAAFFVSRRRNRRRTVDAKYQEKYIEDVNIEGDESIFTEDSAAFKYIPGKLNSAHSVASSSAKSGKRSNRSGSSSGGERLPRDIVAVSGVRTRSVAQFDPANSAATIALGIDGQIIGRDSAASSQKSSPVMSLNEERHGNMKNLTDAIEHGDWDAVAKLAAHMDEESEGGSSLSDYSSAREQLSHRSSVSSMNSGDSIRAAQIQDMVERGDWNGVATAAQFFSSSKSLGSDANRSLGSVERGGTDRSIPGSPKRSFLDFVTGRRTMPSAAASAAIVPNVPDLVEQDSDVSEALANVGPPEDIPSILDAGQNNTMDTQSSSSHGSRKDAESPEKLKRQRRWIERIMSSRSTKAAQAKSGSDADGATKTSTTSLQADLNEALDRGDWGAVEEISANLDVSGTRGVSSSSRARGKTFEDGKFILGAASLASMKKSPKRPGVSPIASIRAEIDEAVSNGNWDEVERLTTQLLNTKPSPMVQDMMTDTLLSQSPSSARTSPAKSPFRDTPSSSEWSQSPVDKEVRTEKLRKLIAAKDWKGVHVLSGIYEMEAKGTLPPTFASMSGDSAENADFALGWLRGAKNNNSTPPESVEGTERRSQRHQPPSPSTSTSTNNSTELREFERLVNAQDWKGLAHFAGAEDDLDHDLDDGELLPRNLFAIDPLAPRKQPISEASGANEFDHVDLRETEGQQPKVLKDDDDSDVESIHGTERLIPHWQELVDKNSDSKPSGARGG